MEPVAESTPAIWARAIFHNNEALAARAERPEHDGLLAVAGARRSGGKHLEGRLDDCTEAANNADSSAAQSQLTSGRYRRFSCEVD